ncbi:hypothetical protein RUND412_002640, partial [Rhizina undulata]
LLQLLLTGANIVAIGSWLLKTLQPDGKLESSQFPNSIEASKLGKRFGVEKSKIADEFLHSVDGAPEENWHVKSLWIFPVKSCAGIELQESRVVSTGLEYDRQFTFITQRQYPLMSQIYTSITPPSSNSPSGTLSLSFPLRTFFGKPTFRAFHVPLAANKEEMLQCPLVPVKVWGDSPLAFDISSLVAGDLQALEKFLGTKGRLALFRTCENQLRVVRKNAPKVEVFGRETVTKFSDSFPMHMLNLASIRELNSRVLTKIPYLTSRRFRANIIVSGPKAFDEDNWRLISFGKNLCHTACLTTRCKLPNVDPNTGGIRKNRIRQCGFIEESIREIREKRVWDCNLFRLMKVPSPFLSFHSFVSVLRVGDVVTVRERGDLIFAR